MWSSWQRAICWHRTVPQPDRCPLAEVTTRSATMLQALDEWKAREKERQDAYAGVMDGLDASADAAADAPQFVAYVPLPDQKEIEQRVRANSRARVTTSTLGPEDAFSGVCSTCLITIRSQAPSLALLSACFVMLVGADTLFPMATCASAMLALLCIVRGAGCSIAIETMLACRCSRRRRRTFLPSTLASL